MNVSSSLSKTLSLIMVTTLLTSSIAGARDEPSNEMYNRAAACEQAIYDVNMIIYNNDIFLENMGMAYFQITSPDWNTPFSIFQQPMEAYFSEFLKRIPDSEKAQDQYQKFEYQVALITGVNSTEDPLCPPEVIQALAKIKNIRPDFDNRANVDDFTKNDNPPSNSGGGSSTSNPEGSGQQNGSYNPSAAGDQYAGSSSGSNPYDSVIYVKLGGVDGGTCGACGIRWESSSKGSCMDEAEGVIQEFGTGRYGRGC